MLFVKDFLFLKHMIFIHSFWFHCSRCVLLGIKIRYAIFADKFMTKSILDSIGMYDTFIFVGHLYLKMNLGKSLQSK